LGSGVAVELRCVQVCLDGAWPGVAV